MIFLVLTNLCRLFSEASCWHWVCIHQMNQTDACNSYGRDDNTIIITARVARMYRFWLVYVCVCVCLSGCQKLIPIPPSRRRAVRSSLELILVDISFVIRLQCLHTLCGCGLLLQISRVVCSVCLCVGHTG